jgi:hypothetical protein
LPRLAPAPPPLPSPVSGSILITYDLIGSNRIQVAVMDVPLVSNVSEHSVCNRSALRAGGGLFEVGRGPGCKLRGQGVSVGAEGFVADGSS